MTDAASRAAFVLARDRAPPWATSGQQQALHGALNAYTERIQGDHSGNRSPVPGPRPRSDDRPYPSRPVRRGRAALHRSAYRVARSLGLRPWPGCSARRASDPSPCRSAQSPGSDPGASTGATGGRSDQGRRGHQPTVPIKEDPHGSHGRRASGRRSDPPVHDRDPRGGPRGPACPHRGHALAREGGRRGCLAGRAAGDDPGARALLGDRVRLAQVRGEAQRLPAVHHRDRRAGHPLRPRSLQARGRAAADRLPRMAGLVRRADEDRRSAHRPDRAWRRARRTPSTW